MRQVLDVDRVSEVNYLTGDDPYKATWMTHHRERIGLIACNKRTVSGLARAAIEFAGALRQRRLARPGDDPTASELPLSGRELGQVELTAEALLHRCHGGAEGALRHGALTATGFRRRQHERA
jgi:hypothetical protein